MYCNKNLTGLQNHKLIVQCLTVLVHCVHDGKKKDSFGYGIVSYGRRYNKLKKTMEAMLGKTEAMQKIDKHSGIRSSDGTQTLLNFGPRKGKKGKGK